MLLSVLVLACRSDDAPPAGPTGETGTPTSPGASAGCGSSSVTPGRSDGAITSGGVERTWVVEVPPAYDGATPLPLVIDLHGTGSTGDEQRFLSGLDEAAREDGFVAVWPESLEVLGLKAFALTCASPDVDYVSDLLDHLESTLCIDRSRVVVTGLSNGGYFTNILGSVLGDRIAAVAPVAGGPGAVPLLCRPDRALPATIVHGDADGIVPLSEGEATAELWAEAAGCAPPSTADADGCLVTSGCDAEVRLCVGEGAGHVSIYALYPATERIRELIAR